MNYGEHRCTHCAANGCGVDNRLCRAFLNLLMEEAVRETALETASAARALANRKAMRARQRATRARQLRGLINPMSSSLVLSSLRAHLARMASLEGCTVMNGAVLGLDRPKPRRSNPTWLHVSQAGVCVVKASGDKCGNEADGSRCGHFCEERSRPLHTPHADMQQGSDQEHCLWCAPPDDVLVLDSAAAVEMTVVPGRAAPKSLRWCQATPTQLPSLSVSFCVYGMVWHGRGL